MSDFDHHEFAEKIDRIESFMGYRLVRMNDLVKTRDGRRARIICVDRKNSRAVTALVTNENGTESTHDYYPDGKFYVSTIGPSHPLDLISSILNVPLKGGE